MCTKGDQYLRSQSYFQRLSGALEFAVSEWLFIFLLFIDACFSYLITKFAFYRKLQGQCLLCSRLDHVLAKDKTGNYWDSLCNTHKSKISSIALSHVHEMCEKCLFSSADKSKSNAESYRLLVGKMGSDSQVYPFTDGHNHSSSGTRICCCCNESFIFRGYAKNLLHTTSVGSDAAKNDKKNNEDGSFESFRSSHTGKSHIAPLPEVDYQKVNVTSDTESEVPVSDDDCSSPLIPKAHSEPVVKLEVTDNHHGATETETDTTHDLEELQWQQAEEKTDVSTTTKLISFDKVPPSNVAETPVDVSVDTFGAPRTGESKNSLAETEAISKPESEPITTSNGYQIISKPESEPITTSNGYQMSNYLDLSDAYKLATSSKGRELSGKLLDHKFFQDSSTRVSEDLKLLLSQRSSFQGIELPSSDNLISPKLSLNSDEFKTSDSSISMGMQFLQRRISLERNESNISLEGSVLSDIEGESAIDRLKRQVEHDKKLMSALYKELEEERNASAIATNQAMAMITRLQEEKAALYTEALQSLRMMEEQAEYNGEALQKANDIIEEKERVIQELEAEIQLLRKTSEDARE